MNAPKALSTSNGFTDYPRITDKMTVAQLREEVKARKLEPGKVPRLKADLLHHLVEGSIHVKETKIYKDYENLLKQLEIERPKLHENYEKKRHANEERKEAQRQAKKLKEEQKQQEEERVKKQVRESEKARQTCHHTNSFPLVHTHPMAMTGTLKRYGRSRSSYCTVCKTKPNLSGFVHPTYERPNLAIFTCEQCEWDICQECFVSENKSEAEKQADRKRQEEEVRDRWDPKKRFKPKILVPPIKHKDASVPLKFTVWYSNGYDYDGWHSYEGPPRKEFDSSWKTKAEANNRAEYMFFWKNPWGIKPTEVCDDFDGPPSPSQNDGMDTWSFAPSDSSRWTVGVVPAPAYPHLENASNDCHNYDESRGGCVRF